MAKAIWNGQLLAESNKTVMVEGNHYFPADSINKAFFQESSRTSVCHWKGVASYYDLVVNGEVNKGAAWTYSTPKSAAENIKGHVAFWGGVRIEA
jgi:uncharacterized protein (DUF427 family)